MLKILNFDGKINENFITIICYKNGIIVGDFGYQMNVCHIEYLSKIITIQFSIFSPMEISFSEETKMSGVFYGQ